MSRLMQPTAFFYSPHCPREARFEHTRVEMLLRALGLSGRTRELLNYSKMAWSVSRLTFSLFDEMFPSFSWRLVSKSFYRVDGLVDPAYSMRWWFTDFDKTLIWHWYKIFHRQHLYYSRTRTSRGTPVPDSRQIRPLGMIFPLGGIKGGLIIHNGPPQTLSPRFVYDDFQLETEQVDMRCRVEGFGAWSRAIAQSGWTPAGRDQHHLEPRQRKFAMREGAWVKPWMVGALGIGPDTLVLAWLCRLLRMKPQLDARRFLRREGGRRCVHITQADLADELGLSQRQVRSGLQSLRRHQLVESRGTNIWLNHTEIERLSEYQKRI